MVGGDAGSSRYSGHSGASPDEIQQQSPYVGVPLVSHSHVPVPVPAPLVSRNPSASVCDIIRQTPAKPDKGSPSSLGARTPRDRRPFSESSEELILQGEGEGLAVQNGTAKVKAHKRRQKQNQQLQQLQQQHMIQQQQLLKQQQILQQQQLQQRQLQEQQQRLKEKPQQQQQGRFVFERPDDNKTVIAPSAEARATRTVMAMASAQSRRDQRRPAATARVTPECCAAAAAAAAAAAGNSSAVATAAGNSWQLATTAGHSSTVDSRRRAPPAAQRRQRRNRSAENLLAQCDCDRRFFEEQESMTYGSDVVGKG